MCGHCGCASPSGEHHHEHGDASPGHGAGQTVDLNQSVLSFNDRLAEQNRGYFRARGLIVINLLSGPGAGKTTLIEQTLKTLGDEIPMAVIVGDLETENDAERLRSAGGQAVQITTGEVCHLDAHMVQHALERLDQDGLRLLLIENVGNLVCPASFDLGEEARIVMLSSTEGEDKPLKYPVIFQGADLVLLNKMDLAEAVEFDRDQAVENVRKVAPRADLLEISAGKGKQLEDWFSWLRTRCGT